MICPYCDENNDALSFNKEHIIPHGLGGALDFSILVHEKCNSTLGTILDAPFLADKQISALCHKYNIKKRSGESKLTYETELIEGKKGSVTFTQNGDVKYHSAPKIEINGKNIRVTVLAEDEERITKQITDSYGKKGKNVKIANREKIVDEHPTVEVKFEINLSIIKREMIKILWGAAFKEWDESVIKNNYYAPIFQKLLFHEGPIDKAEFPICGSSKVDLTKLCHSIPGFQLKGYEHLVILSHQNKQTHGIVSLFGQGGNEGGGPLQCCINLAQDGLEVTDKQGISIYVVDPIARTCQSRRWP